MADVFTDTLHSWQNFYFMIGGASAGLMGLMFVALSLGTHLVNDETRASFPAFVTPSIIYFSIGAADSECHARPYFHSTHHRHGSSGGRRAGVGAHIPACAPPHPREQPASGLQSLGLAVAGYSAANELRSHCAGWPAFCVRPVGVGLYWHVVGYTDAAVMCHRQHLESGVVDY